MPYLDRTRLSCHHSYHARSVGAPGPSRPLVRDVGLAVRAAGEVAAFFQPSVVQPIFTTFNTVLLPPWFLMILAPNSDFTKSLIRSGAPMLVFTVLYAYLFAAATAQNGAQGSDFLADVLYLFTEATAGIWSRAYCSDIRLHVPAQP
jgi:hypothetical protein